MGTSPEYCERSYNNGVHIGYLFCRTDSCVKPKEIAATAFSLDSSTACTKVCQAVISLKKK